jgi:tRNA-Thr(GGU) m(6)t(6)A37 methyltransferase TsaA
MKPVAIIHTPFREKFGIPRQPGLVESARGRVELLPPFDRPGVFSGLEGFSHVWLIWIFHAVPEGEWKPLVRPPRLGGNRKVGVFASRSPFRPNPIGLSVVRLEAVQETSLDVSGVDLLDGTPILDIKPYIPYSDALADAKDGFAAGPPPARLRVAFSKRAEEQLFARPDGERLRELIIACIETDPRPAYKYGEEGEYGFLLEDFDLRWCVAGTGATVLELRSP